MHELPKGGYQRSDSGSYSPARQVRDSSLRPRAHHSFDSLLDQSQHAADPNVLQVSDLHQLFVPARDIAAAPQAPVTLSGVPRATPPHIVSKCV